MGGTEQQKASVAFAVVVDEPAQRGEDGRHALRLVQDQTLGVVPPLQLKRRLLREQVA